MKSRHSAATIKIYFLFTFIWMALFINASEIKNTKHFPEMDNAIAQNFQQNVLEPSYVNTMKLLHSIKAHILSTIFNEFLTIQEILTLRKTCIDFQILILPNDKNMVMFCKNFSSKEMDNMSLMWFDVTFLFLRFFFFCLLQQTSAF